MQFARDVNIVNFLDFHWIWINLLRSTESLQTREFILLSIQSVATPELKNILYTHFMGK